MNQELPLNEHLLYTVNETAQLLKVNKKTVYDLIDGGLLKTIRLGRTKITKKTLLKFLEEFDGYDLSNLENVKCIAKYKNEIA